MVAFVYDVYFRECHRPFVFFAKTMTDIGSTIQYGNSCQANNYFAIYLRESIKTQQPISPEPLQLISTLISPGSANYSVSQRNIIPACANLVTMLTDFAYGFGSDMSGNRIYWIILPLLATTLPGASILTAWPDSDAARVAGFFLVAGGYVTAVTWTWANEVNSGNAEERALTISSMNGLFYATSELFLFCCWRCWSILLEIVD